MTERENPNYQPDKSTAIDMLNWLKTETVNKLKTTTGDTSFAHEFVKILDNQPPQDFSGCKVGQELYSARGILIVDEIFKERNFLRAHFKGQLFGTIDLLFNGKVEESDLYPFAFLDKPIIIAPAQPKRKVKKQIMVRTYWDSENKASYTKDYPAETNRLEPIPGGHRCICSNQVEVEVEE